MKTLETLIRHLNGVLVFIGGFLLLAMVALTGANIVTRVFWQPIRGSFELMGLMGAVVTAFALGYTQLHRSHIAVDVLINACSRRTRAWANAVNSTVCSLFFAALAWKLAHKATVLWQTGEITETLRIIYYPFTYAAALGCGFLALVFLLETLQTMLAKSGNAA